MTVISFVSPKGGAGKTTSSIVLATELARTGEQITIIDADPNQPVLAWSKLPNKPENLIVIADQSEETILDNIRAATESSKIVIIDLEGTANMRVSYAVSRSDLVLIPTKPSMLDAKEATKTISLIRRTQEMSNRTIDHAVLFTQIPAALTTKNYKHIRSQYEELNIPILDVQMIEREAYRSIFSIGGSIYSLNKKDVGGLEAARNNSFAFASAVIEKLKAQRHTSTVSV